jgi:DNA-directed RNA polymerase specialized sigma24 family protein
MDLQDSDILVHDNKIEEEIVDKLTVRKSNQGKPANYYFDNEHYTSIWVEYYKPETTYERKEAIRSEITLVSLKIAKILIRKYKLFQFADSKDLEQEAMYKVLRDFEQFDPNRKNTKSKPNAFNFLTTIMKNHMFTYVYGARKYNYRWVSIDDVNTDSSPLSSSIQDTASTTSNNSATSLTSIYHQSTSNPNNIPFIHEDIHTMYSILADSPIGKDILEYLHITIHLDGTITTNTPNSIHKYKNKKVSLKSLLVYLKKHKKRNYKDCLTAIEALKELYSKQTIG